MIARRRQLDRQRQPVEPAQISATAAAFSSVSAKSGRTRPRALDEERAPPRSERGCAAVRRPGEDRAAPAAAPGTRARRRRSAARLVDQQLQARSSSEQIAQRAAPPRAPARSCRAPAAVACRAGTRASASASGRAPASATPRVCAIVGSTSSGRASPSEPDEEDAVGETARSSSAPAWSARRVLPTPPGPVSVTSRTPARSSSRPPRARARARSAASAAPAGSSADSPACVAAGTTLQARRRRAVEPLRLRRDP